MAEQPIQIKIRAQDGQEITFKVKGHTPFQKIFNAYCQKTGLEQGLLRFVFDGERVRVEKTPADLQMEDGDVIDVMVEQQGGSSCCC